MIRTLAALLCSLLVAACGFQLRGSTQLPFTSLHIALPESSELRAALARTVTSSSQTRIVDDPRQAQAILSVLSDEPSKRILTLNPAGRVTEYQVVRTVVFQVADPNGREIIPRSQITLHRDITFSDNQVLSKESEEALLWRDMQTDLTQQLLRRLAAANPKRAAAE